MLNNQYGKKPEGAKKLVFPVRVQERLINQITALSVSLGLSFGDMAHKVIESGLKALEPVVPEKRKRKINIDPDTYDFEEDQ